MSDRVSKAPGTDFTEPDIVEENVNNVRWFAAVFPADFGEFGVNVSVLFRPSLAVLLLQDVMLGVVDYSVLGIRISPEQRGEKA